MLSIRLTSIVAVLVCAVDSKIIAGQGPMINDRIYKGQDANIEDFPYQVSLQWKGTHTCGGSIINSRVILTAGHCISNETAEYYTIRAGSSYHNRDGIIRNVAKIIIHESFIMDITSDDILTKIDYDIALLILSNDLEFSNTIQPIELPDEDDDLEDDDFATLTGWGSSKPYLQKQSEILQKTDIPVINQELCAQESPNLVPPRMLCAGFRRAFTSNACSGDSGGPLVKNGIVYGISSWSNKNCVILNGISGYTRVSALRSWIDYNIPEELKY